MNGNDDDDDAAEQAREVRERMRVADIDVIRQLRIAVIGRDRDLGRD